MFWRISIKTFIPYLNHFFFFRNKTSLCPFPNSSLSLYQISSKSVLWYWRESITDRQSFFCICSNSTDDDNGINFIYINYQAFSPKRRLTSVGSFIFIKFIMHARLTLTRLFSSTSWVWSGNLRSGVFASTHSLSPNIS